MSEHFDPKFNNREQKFHAGSESGASGNSQIPSAPEPKSDYSGFRVNGESYAEPVERNIPQPSGYENGAQFYGSSEGSHAPGYEIPSYGYREQQHTGPTVDPYESYARFRVNDEPYSGPGVPDPFEGLPDYGNSGPQYGYPGVNDRAYPNANLYYDNSDNVPEGRHSHPTVTPHSDGIRLHENSGQQPVQPTGQGPVTYQNANPHYNSPQNAGAVNMPSQGNIQGPAVPPEIPVLSSPAKKMLNLGNNQPEAGETPVPKTQNTQKSSPTRLIKEGTRDAITLKKLGEKKPTRAQAVSSTGTGKKTLSISKGTKGKVSAGNELARKIGSVQTSATNVGNGNDPNTAQKLNRNPIADAVGLAMTKPELKKVAQSAIPKINKNSKINNRLAKFIEKNKKSTKFNYINTGKKMTTATVKAAGNTGKITVKTATKKAAQKGAKKLAVTKTVRKTAQQVTKQTIKKNWKKVLPWKARLIVTIVENIPLVIAMVIAISSGVCLASIPYMRTTLHVPAVGQIYKNGVEPTDEEKKFIHENIEKGISYSGGLAENKTLISQLAVDSMNKVYEKHKSEIEQEPAERSDMESSAVFVNGIRQNSDDVKFYGVNSPKEHTINYTFLGEPKDPNAVSSSITSLYIYRPEGLPEINWRVMGKYYTSGWGAINYCINGNFYIQNFLPFYQDEMEQYFDNTSDSMDGVCNQRRKAVIGWSFKENSEHPDFERYQKIDDTCLSALLQHANNGNVLLYPVYGKAGDSVHSEEISVVTRDEITGKYSKWFDLNDLRIEYAYVDANGETVYSTVRSDGLSNGKDSIAYRSYNKASLMKAILGMATVATENDDYKTESGGAEDIWTQYAKADVYINYCKSLMEMALKSSTNFGVSFETVVLEGTKGTENGMEWQGSDGVTYVADNVKMSCVVTVYIDVSADSIMDNDDRTYLQYNANSMEQTEGYSLVNTGRYNFGGWTKKNKEWVLEYLQYDSETFNEMFQVVFPTQSAYLDSDDEVANTIFSVLHANGFSNQSAAAVIANIKYYCGTGISEADTIPKNFLHHLWNTLGSTRQADYESFAEPYGSYANDNVALQATWLVQNIESSFATTSGQVSDIYNSYNTAFQTDEQGYNYALLGSVEKFKKLSDLQRANVAFNLSYLQVACPPGVTGPPSYAKELTRGSEYINTTVTEPIYETRQVFTGWITITDQNGRQKRMLSTTDGLDISKLFSNGYIVYHRLKMQAVPEYTEQQFYAGSRTKTVQTLIQNRLNDIMKIITKQIFPKVKTSGASGSGDVEGFIDIALAIAKDDTHGYASGALGPNYDCGTFVYKCLHDAGVIPNDWYVSYPTAFCLFGKLANSSYPSGWDIMPFTGVENLQRGDIIMRSTQSDPTGHTAIYLGDHRIVDAENPTDGILENGYYPAEYNIVARYTQGGSTRQKVYEQPRYIRFFSNADVGGMINPLEGDFGSTYRTGYAVTTDPNLPIGTILQIECDTENNILPGYAIERSGMEIGHQSNCYVVVSNGVNLQNAESVNAETGQKVMTPEKIGDEYILYLYTNSSAGNVELEASSKYYRTPDLVRTLFYRYKKTVENAEELTEFVKSQIKPE